MTPGAVSQADGAVLSQQIRIKQHPGLRLQTVLDIEDALVLETRVAREEIFVSFLVRTPNLLIVPEVCQILKL